jgi:S-adenosylmethionine:tRNA ribosyltransferase-isomerase
VTRTADYDYLLPPELIAQEPAEQRDRSRLLVLDRRTGACSDHGFGELPALLPPGALLVLNNSRVFPARLLGRKPTGGAVELLLVRREPDPRARWVALARTSKKLRAGQAIAFDHHRVTCRVEALLDDGAVRVEIEGFEDPASPHRESFQAWLERVGETPLPPYIQREGGERPFDRERYQTVYAGPTGSVAAPTAGLHFTPALLATLQERGIERAFVTLHVGPGTFRPVRAERAEDHVMDAEHGLLPSETVEAVERALAAPWRGSRPGTAGWCPAPLPRTCTSARDFAFRWWTA